MDKVKSSFVGILCILLFSLGFVNIVNADTPISGTNYVSVSDLSLYDTSTQELYEFSDSKSLNSFLELQTGVSARSYSGFQTRTILARTYNKVSQSNNVARTVYGGSRGGTVSVSAGVSSSIEGLTVSVGHGASYKVPARQYGNIVIKANIAHKVYHLQQKAPGSSTWKYSGQYTTKHVVSSWYAPVYRNTPF